MITIKPLPAIKDNYIWVIQHSEDRDVYIVDPGEAEPVHRFLRENQAGIKKILLTHQHWDHVTGIAELVSLYHCPVYGPKIEKHPTVTHTLSEGDTVALWDDLSATIWETPGHMPDHICWLLHGSMPLSVLCADTLFSIGCGRIFRGTPEELFNSLKRLAELPDETRLYPAHEYTLANLNFALTVEPDNQDLILEYQRVTALRQSGTASLPTSVAKEKHLNPFLRCKEEAIWTAVSRYVGRKLTNELEVFTELRRWKDVY